MKTPETEKTVEVTVKITAQNYREFVMFNLLRHQKSWVRPAIFAAIMLAAAGICLSQVGIRQGAGLLCAVLSIIGLGMPIVYFATFMYNMSRQFKAMEKAGPTTAYRLRLTGEGLDVWVVGELDRQQPSQQYPWAKQRIAYRTGSAIYLYVEQNKAFLLPLDQLSGSADDAWSLAQQAQNSKSFDK